MSQSELKQLLQRLQAEIEDLKTVSSTEKRELETLIRNIRQASEQDDKNTETDLQESLNSAVVRLEASHPRLTAVLNDIMVTLSNMGI